MTSGSGCVFQTVGGAVCVRRGQIVMGRRRKDQAERLRGASEGREAGVGGLVQADFKALVCFGWSGVGTWVRLPHLGDNHNFDLLKPSPTSKIKEAPQVILIRLRLKAKSKRLDQSSCWPRTMEQTKKEERFTTNVPGSW